MESVKKNIIYQTVYQLLTIILPIITAPYIARVIGAEGIGTYSYTYSIASYFVLFAKLGIHVYGNKAIAAVREDQKKLNKTFSEILLVHVIVSLLALVCYGGYVLSAPEEYKLIAAIQSLYVAAELLDVNWLYFGLEKFKVTVTRNTAIKFGTIVATFLFVRDSGDVWVYCLIMAASMAISEAVVWIFLPRYVKFVKPEWVEAKRHLGPMLTYFIPSVAVSLYKVMDKIMLGTMAGTVQTGFYENAEKIINIALSFVTAVGTVMMPRMTNLIATGNTMESKKIIQKSMDFIYIAAYAMCFGIIGIAEVFPTVFWGEEFTECSILMSGLAISLVITAVANVIRTQYLIPRGKDRLFVASVCVGAVVNLLVNWLCIPCMKAVGAVVGTIAAEWAVFAIQAFFTRKELPISKSMTSNAVYAVLGIAMCVLCRVIGNWLGVSVMTLVLQVVAGAVFYVAGVLVIWKLRDQDEYLNELTGIIRQKKF